MLYPAAQQQEMSKRLSKCLTLTFPKNNHIVNTKSSSTEVPVDTDTLPNIVLVFRYMKEINVQLERRCHPGGAN